MNIYAVMVIYNKSLKEARAYSHLKQNKIKTIICDNSTEQNKNAETAGEDGAAYLSMNGNAGLSKAYNRAIEYIGNMLGAQDEDWVCLFDDDTMISEEYFRELQGGTGDILLPIVKDSAGIMSPVKLKKSIVTRLGDREAVFHEERKWLSGINSGMAIRMRIFREYRYNEEMFLDYIDHMFIMDMRKQKIYPQVLDVELEQRFSAAEDDKEAARRRFIMQKRDLRIFYRNARGAYWYVIIKKHIKLAVKYRDLGMLFH